MAMSNRWEDAEDLLVACAGDDLRATGDVHPALVAFAGRRLRFVAWVRPFPKGAYGQPLTELFALAAPLDCDRLMLSFGARAWSLEDPIPPVTTGADLRQRVLLLYVVDAADGGAPRLESIMHPFDLDADGPRWGARRVLEGGEGWVPEAMRAIVAGRAALRASTREIAKQAARVVRLGHDLHLAPDLADQLQPHAATPATWE
jgi:hypothetical protein